MTVSIIYTFICVAPSPQHLLPNYLVRHEKTVNKSWT